ncbi:ABC transporter, partial [Laccaria bicolor S238N-H82]
RNVSFHYPGCQNHPSVCNVSLTIEPGQLVVLVGVNGSGKTSLLKLIAGLSCACGGEIEIDDHPVHEYDSRHLRRSMAFMTSSEDIYPVSLRENILMGLDDCGFELSDVAEKIEEAARLGGAYDVVQRLGQDAILNPCRVLGQSLRGCGNGEIGDAALRELDLHSPALMILDEPTSALDSMAERDFFKRFREIGNGKTMIFVTHRFGSIVKNADMILCIDGGKVVQQGTHAELIEKNGRYAELYNVQAAAFSSS